MTTQNLFPKTKVLFSPVGPGIVTGETNANYFKVNHVAVAWLILYHEEHNAYYAFDPCRHLAEGKVRIFFKKDHDARKDPPVNIGSIVVGSQEQFLAINKDIGHYGFINEVILKN